MKSDFDKKEKIFCVFSQISKATVQAAIGGVTLSIGLACKDVTLSIAVILIDRRTYIVVLLYNGATIINI